jgi:hypothetical protein
LKPENITKLRRQNAIALYRTWAQERMAAGDPPKGLEQAFAAVIEISASMWSQVKSSRPIGDKLARQIEHHLGAAPGWLDAVHPETEVVDEGERRFIEAAREAWRAANAVEKRRLMQSLVRPARET